LTFESERAFLPSVWAGGESEVGAHVELQSKRCLDAYRANALLVQEHANIERATAQGGYGRRQIFELVQNAADALVAYPRGRIYVLLTETALYCANEGEPIDLEGVDAILSSHVSMKRGTEIGRFGLGFKSVLGVTNRPEFYSRSGSFGFDPDTAQGQIRAIVPSAERIPMLRIARPLDPVAAAEADPVLAQLMVWATTVVKLPRDPTRSSWLGEDVANFPPEFLLFSAHVGTLTLSDHTVGSQRVIRLERFGSEFRLVEDRNVSTWRVFETVHTLSDKARGDAGALADRPQLPVIWAVQMEGRPGRGRFWAFFPTEYQTTLSGLLNAPWKTNEDRQNLLKGEFNDELLKAAADLVVENLPKLFTEKDPGRLLDILPARKDESPNWADELLNEYVYRRAAQRPSLPDQTGALVVPSGLQMHPSGVPREALEAWAAYPERPQNWCHLSIDTRERRPRAERLLATAGRAPDSLARWLEALVEPGNAASSIAAIRVAGIIAETDATKSSELTRAAIVLTDRGTWVAPGPGRVFLAGDAYFESGLPLVHPEVASSSEARRALENLGIQPVDAAVELERLLGSYIGPADEGKWTLLWDLTRRLEPPRAAEIVRKNRWQRPGRIRVRTLNGSFRPVVETLLPGPIVPEDGSRDASVAVDTQFHEKDLELLTVLGAAASPTPGRGTAEESWFADYRGEVVGEYLELLGARGPRPQRDRLRFDRATFLGPLEPILHLTEEGRTRFTDAVLAAEPDPQSWTLAHSTLPDKYPSRRFPSPTLWLIRREGRLRTSRGVRAVPRCVGPGLAELADFFPVADCSPRTADVLGLPNTFSGLRPGLWAAAMEAAGASTNDGLLGRLYAVAARYVESPPASIRCRVGGVHQTVPRETVTVVAERRELEALASGGVPVLLVSAAEDAELLVERWGLLPRDRYVRTEVYHIPSAPEIPLIEAFPTLRAFLREEHYRLQLATCYLLRLETLTDAGKTVDDTVLHIEDDTIYYQEDLDTRSLIDRLAFELRLEMTGEDRAAVVGHRDEQARRARIAAVRRESTLEGRLLAAVGAQAIRRRLRSALIEAVAEMQGEPSDERLARLALSVYGVDALRVFGSELEERGFQPPTHWAGGRNARAFARALGFPREFAGFRRADRDPLVDVEGPPNLPPLHEFQETIVTRTRHLLNGAGRKRGLLSLPTGAGKTRIVVQALIEAVRDDAFRGPILWIAQTDELCEQAVQTWSYVWRAAGAGRRLGISRLWAVNEAEPIEGGDQIVIATIAKLGGCVGDPDYEWLSQAECVVVDEAHGATESSYTEVLEWLGLGRGRDRCPLIGLTATPFRGISKEETERLVRRFGEYRLDAGAFDGDPYAALQRIGVLAHVRHRLLEGTVIELSEDELKQLKLLRRLPPSVEDRLGADKNRNRILLESIRALPDNWTVLLFAASVDHAETMAGLLSLQGVPAAAISAGTDPGARRHYVEEFRVGRIRVLTNYGVLSQGFDAPAVRAVYVARPTFSPNLYQQMIGRGLRGPLNGGKEECLIVNVADNVLLYEEKLAFTHFEYLWKGT